MNTKRCLFALLTVLLMPSALLAGQTFHVAATKEASQVVFRSKATLETFEGKTHDLSGYIELDPADLSVLKGELVCDLTELDTGIGLRNKHMRNNVLHTDDYPTATFTLESGSGGSLTVGAPIELTVKGQMTLHGETHPLQATVQATLVSNQVLEFLASFAVKLDEFSIKRPKMLLMKVAETVNLTVTARATAGPPPKRTN